MPASPSSVDSGTPVNSLHASMPCVYCTVGTATLPHSMPVLAPHSMKCMRDTDGKRMSSSIVSTSGRATSPWIISRCCAGSTSGMPE